MALASRDKTPDAGKWSIKGDTYGKRRRSDEVGVVLLAGVRQLATSENLTPDMPVLQRSLPQNCRLLRPTPPAPGTILDPLSPILTLSQSHFDFGSQIPPQVPLLCTWLASAPGCDPPLQAWTKAMFSSWPHASNWVLLVHPLKNGQKDPSGT